MESSTTPNDPSQILQTGGYRQLVNSARVHFAEGRYPDAKAGARSALDLMEPVMSSNNPQLASTYVLHADASLGCITSKENAREHLSTATVSLARAVAVLEQGMLTMELCLVKLRLVGGRFALGEIEEGLPLAFSLREQAAELAFADDGRSNDFLMCASHLLATGLITAGRHAEAKSVIYKAVHELRAEHYHNPVVVRYMQELLALQQYVLKLEAA